MSVLFRGGTVVTLDPARRVLQGDVLVDGGRILAVGEVPPGRPAAEEVVDCRGRYVLPGLVQSHVHLCQTLFRNHADGLELLDWLRERIWPLEGAHTHTSLGASARLGIAELIRGGTTACLDMGTVHHTDALFEAAAASGFRLTSGKAMMDVSEGLPAGLRETPQASLAESDALSERWHGAEEGRLRYAYAPRFVLSCGEKLLRAVAERAAAPGVRVHTHASENRNEVEAVRARCGADNVEYLHRLGLAGPGVALAHCIWLTEREERLLVDTGTHVLHCPSSNLKLGSGIARIPELLARGAQVSLGADGAPCNNNLDAWTEMRLAALIHLPRVGPRGLPARRVLELATLGGARALGLEHEIGSLEPGKRADVIVVRADAVHQVPVGDDVYGALVYATRAADVEHVYVDGRPLMLDRRLTTLDEAAVTAEAARHARELARAAL